MSVKRQIIYLYYNTNIYSVAPQIMNENSNLYNESGTHLFLSK